MKNVLVTGNGGISKVLVEKLVYTTEVKNIYCVSRSVLPGLTITPQKPLVHWWCKDLSEISSRFFHGTEIDTVFHLAGLSTNNHSEEDLFVNNILATQKLLQAVPKGVRFVFASSSTVYGSQNKTLSETDDLRPTSYYGASKVTGEALVGVKTALGSIKGVNLRLCANVGKGFTHGVLPDIIKKIYSEELTLNLISNSRKPFMFVEDTADIMIRFGQNELTGAFNVCASDNISVGEIAQMAMHETGVHKDIIWAAQPIPGDNLEVRLDDSKMIKQLGLPYGFPSTKSVFRAIQQILEEKAYA